MVHDEQKSSHDTGQGFGPLTEPTRYLTADLPGVGGALKERPEDFLVDELPLYDPCGEGEHLYLYIEKRGLATSQVIRMLAKHFGVQRRSIGVAGLKDKHAVTRQLLSVHVPGRTASDFSAFEHPRVSILWAAQHRNMLRRGHLRGNRFVIRVRKVDPGHVVRAHSILRRLARSGVPNWFGQQRFGRLGNNHLIGRALLTADHETILREMFRPDTGLGERQARARDLFAEGRFDEAWDVMPHTAHAERSVLKALARGRTRRQAAYSFDRLAKRFYISALQSAVFNRVLDQRIRAGKLGSLVDGDLACKHENGAVFKVDDGVLREASTTERLEGLEISPSGPMWGPSMPRAAGGVDQIEREALRGAGLSPDDLLMYEGKSGDKLSGERRPLRIPISNIDVEGGVDEHGPYIRCAFDLPKGSFATVVMSEIMKPDGRLSGDEDEWD